MRVLNKLNVIIIIIKKTHLVIIVYRRCSLENAALSVVYFRDGTGKAAVHRYMQMSINYAL